MGVMASSLRRHGRRQRVTCPPCDPCHALRPLSMTYHRPSIECNCNFHEREAEATSESRAMSVKSTVINSIPLWCVDPIVFFELDEVLPQRYRPMATQPMERVGRSQPTAQTTSNLPLKGQSLWFSNATMFLRYPLLTSSSTTLTAGTANKIARAST